jgi:two-component system sensor histidine kinase BarA
MAFKRYGLRSRVIVYNLLPVLVVGLFFSSFYIFNRYNQVEQDLVEHGTSIIEPLTLAIEGPLGEERLDTVRKIVNYAHRINSDLVDTIAVFDLASNLFVTSRYVHDFSELKQPFDNKLSPITSVHFHNNSIILRTPIFSEVIDNFDVARIIPGYSKIETTDSPTRIVGYVSMKLNKSKALMLLYQDAVLSVFVILIGMILALIFAFNLIKEVVEPIKRMIRAIAYIKDGQLDTRITGSMHGELERLRSGINGMAKSIAEYHNEMQESIDQSTADLRETLEQMEMQNVELDLAKKRAQEAARVKTEFLANMSHELRTPLNGIIGFSKQLYKSKLTPTQHEYLSTIERSAKNLLGIINNILDFSKLEAGKLTLEKIPFSIRDTVNEVLMIIAPIAHEKDIDVSAKIDYSIPDLLVGDPMRLQQVLTNLVSNAVKFTEEGAVNVTMLLVNQPTTDSNEIKIEIIVRDTGIGISPSQQQKIFKPFIQANNSISRTFGGTGLGLVITQKIVTMMGGGLSVKSQVNKGSVFTTTIPMRLANLPNERNPSISGLKNLNVLLVDDCEWARETYAQMMKDWEMNVYVMASVEAVKSISVEHFFAVLIGVHNRENIDEFKNKLDSVDLDAPIIICSNSHDSEFNNSLKSQRVLDVLVKPVSDERLLSCFDKIKNSNEEPVAENVQLITKLNKKVLAVDDNPANLKLISTLLSERVTNVDSCTSGEQAVNLCHINTYDLVFMDIQMPVMDGITALKMIRADELGKNRKTPIVAVTALAIPGERERLMNLGMNEYISKPIDENILIKLLENCSNLGINNQIPEHKRDDDFLEVRNPQIRDEELALKHVSGKKELAREMLEMFMESVIPTQDAISKAGSIPTDQLIKVVHKLAGGAAYSGMVKIQKICNIIEVGLRGGQTVSDVEPELYELDDLLEQVKKQAPEWLKQLD